ncbi:MAG: nucleoside 2-deoxyribosyltransferase [Mesorhizobium sp.]|uniref:PfkB family carbohydrate kinase n=1 Tax=unclassified Mesorhizobium TaxID=325217 RepID=UPI000FCC867B|nr:MULTISPECIES: PfkB family carbohydrate kinase [unclassified Mesorhizobium]RUW76171.1 nucleoside 2-deoxyribosyltransferase [Mesorhizobium sp. M1E.F.Ca.ET.063.01.1.1]TIW10725.1 MAG: nucleoside 2-deoxyribosyltransferase [Mesorhizobium sp.]
MIIVGGVYREECVRPYWSRIFGSAGRAAVALSALSPHSHLTAYAYTGWAEDVRQTMQGFGVATDLREITANVGFHYFHPLSISELVGAPGKQLQSLSANGDVVLRFGMVEGDAVISARRAIYDPQHPSAALLFHANGSTAKELAIVLNEAELEYGVGEGVGDIWSYETVRDRFKADVVVVKRGPLGAVVIQAGGNVQLPAYRSETVFKLGSGDIFSAVFAHLWGERDWPAAQAADFASRAVACYVSTREPQLSLEGLDELAPYPAGGAVGRVYIAAPFFTLAQRWLVDEMRGCLEMLGGQTFSPIHEVGSHGGAEYIAGQDLEGLRSCNAALAVIDGEDAGTLFEVGYARNLGIPVVVLAEAPRPESLTMLEGTGCLITDDFTTAIYQAIWSSMR